MPGKQGEKVSREEKLQFSVDFYNGRSRGRK